MNQKGFYEETDLWYNKKYRMYNERRINDEF